MDEYLIVPKHIMEQQLKQLKTNKPPPEAVEVSNLGKLTGDILKRPGVSDWEKADLLASALQRFLSLKPDSVGPSAPPVALSQATPGLALGQASPVARNESTTSRLLRKRKAEDDAVDRKRVALSLPDDLISEDEDEPISAAVPPVEVRRSGTKRKAALPGHRVKRRRAPELQSRKRKNTEDGDQKAKKKPVLLTLKRKHDGVFEVQKKFKHIRGTKRKFADTIDAENVLRKRTQTGGQLRWIQIY